MRQDPFFAGYPPPVLLAVTTSATRLTHLMTETSQSAVAEAAWFALSAWLEPPYDGLGAIWQRPHAADHFFSLLDEMALRAALGAA